MESRSFLFVPADREKLNKLNEINADAIIIDLEDAVKEAKKQEALAYVKDALGIFDYSKEMFVRINPENWEKEVEVILGFRDVGVVLPKVEDTTLLDMFQKQGINRKVIALVETPRGMVKLEHIVEHPLVYAIGFGGQDYCVNTGMANRTSDLNPVKSRLVMYGKAYNKKVIDMIESEYRDWAKIVDSICDTRDMGFDGKLCIHPRQAKAISLVWQDDMEEIKKWVDLYEANSHGFVMCDGVVLEKPHIQRMKKVLEEYNREKKCDE